MANVYNAAKYEFLIGGMDLDNGGDTLTVCLVNTTYTYDPDHAIATITAQRIAGTSDHDLTNQSVTRDDSGDRAYLDSTDNPTWSSVAAGDTVGSCVVYDNTHASDAPISFHDLTNTPTNGGDITVTWNASGIMALTES